MIFFIINIVSIALIFSFCYHLYKKHNSLLQFGILFAITLLINYPLRLFALHFIDNLYTDINLGLVRSEINILSFLCFVGVSAFIIGYLSFEIRVPQYEYLDADTMDFKQSDFVLLWFIFILSIMGKIIKIATANYISYRIGTDVDLRYSQIIENLHMLGWISFAGIWIAFFKKSLKTTGHYVLLIVSTFTQIIYQLIQGSKTFLTLPFFILVSCYYYSRRKLPVLMIGVAALWYFFFVFPFTSAYRDVVNAEYAQIPEISDFSTEVILRESITNAFKQDSNIGETLNMGMSRFNGADEFYRLITLIPRYSPYKGGKDYSFILVSVIPRFLWADKPTLSPGADYGTILGAATSVTPFPFGEMYWDFGYWGLTIGMLFWGVILSSVMFFLLRFSEKRGLKFFVIAAFIAELYWMTTGEAMLPFIITTVFWKIVLYGLILFAFDLIFYNKNKSVFH